MSLTSKTRILSVVGARPNFMKMAPVLRELSGCVGFESHLVHTGQHYDEAMSQVFFNDLGMPSPDFNLNVGSGSHAVQTAEIMKGFEEVCCKLDPGLVIVAGDVNSTMACSLTAAKLQIPVAHIESGLRSFDRTMPEEINRIVTDSIADLLFTTEESGNENLRREGVSEKKIHFVGNTMIDTLVKCYPVLDRIELAGPLASLDERPYFVVTIHRPANVDEPERLMRVVEILEAAALQAPVLFVTHPRTRERLKHLPGCHKMIDMNDATGRVDRGFVSLLPPLNYPDFIRLVSRSAAVLTDSGGIQEETTFLGIPCLTMRSNTERPITVDVGTNQLVGLERETIIACLSSIMDGKWKAAATPPLWDGRAAERVVAVLRTRYGLS